MLLPNDIKEELSHLYVYALATKAGYSFERKRMDRDSVDVSVCAKGSVDATSKILSPQIDIQLKATSQEYDGDFIPFPLPIKNFRELQANTMTPRILVVLLLPARDESWVPWTHEEVSLKGKAYWLSLATHKESENCSSQTVKIPKTNCLNHVSLKNLMIAVSKLEVIKNECI